MSATQNRSGSQSSGTESPQSPQTAPQAGQISQEKMGQQLVGAADSLSQQLEGDYDTQLEVIGDIHDTDIETYKEFLTDKYGEEGPDAIAFTGDIADNYGIRTGAPDFDPEVYEEQAKENYGFLNAIGEEFDLDIHKIKGNHEVENGVHPGNEATVEAMEEYAEENEEGFNEFEGSYDDFLTEQFDRINDISYDSVELEGGITLVGGGSHYDPEAGADPEAGLEGFLEEYDEDDWEEEEWDDLVSGSWFGLGDVINDAYRKYKDLTDEREEFLPKDVKTEEHKDYEEKYDKIDQLLSEAGEDTVVLTHGAPYGEDEDSIDHYGDKGNQGSIVWKEMLQKHDIESFFCGHHHGGGEEQLYDTQVINVGKGQGVEAGIKQGEVVDYSRVEPDQVQNWDRVSKMREEGPGQVYSSIRDKQDELRADIDRISQQIQENPIDSQSIQSVQGQLDKRGEMLRNEKSMADAISTALGYEKEEIKEVDTDLDVDAEEPAQTIQPQQPQQTQAPSAPGNGETAQAGA